MTTTLLLFPTFLSVLSSYSISVLSELFLFVSFSFSIQLFLFSYLALHCLHIFPSATFSILPIQKDGFVFTDEMRDHIFNSAFVFLKNMKVKIYSH